MADSAHASGGKYETLRRLAVGGMGEVFLARERGQLGFSRLVVIKRMLPQVARNPNYVEMFADEARIIGNLNHPNICQILELGWEDGLPFLALEYVRGESVAEMWDRAATSRKRIPNAIALRILADTAWALHFAHEARDAEDRPLHVVHRDISPQNVMVTFHGDIKLMDFGVARADNRLHRTDTGKIKGKISYMAPEQVRGQPIDRRADVFAVGVMLWELTLNQRLFGGGDEVETLQKAIDCHVPAPRSIDPSYPASLEAIVLQALAADRDRRTQTAGELANALMAELANQGGAERADVAAWLRKLFPDESAAPDDALPTLVDPPIEAVGRQTVPLRVEPPRVEPPRRRSNRFVLAIAAILLAAAAATVFAIEPWASDDDDEPAAPVATSTPVPTARAPAPPASPAPAIAQAVDAAAPEASAEPAVIAITKPLPAPAPRHRRPTAIKDPAPPAAVESRKPEALNLPVAPPPPHGALAVSSDPVGVVVVDGQRRKSTPFQIELAPGDHDVAVELAEGAGTLRARARIDSGKKTKCKAEGGTLTCAESP